MSSQFLQSSPAQPTRPAGDGKLLSPAKPGPGSPSKSRSLPQSPVGGGPGISDADAKEIAKRRRGRYSGTTPTKRVEKSESLCPESKVILNGMAGMFSPKKGEAETPGVLPKIEVEVPPMLFPIKKEGGRKDQMGQGQARRKRVVNAARITRPVRSPADPIPEERSSKHGP